MSKILKITRSFAYKHNAGNYETRDFYCSQEVECTEEELDRTSELAHEWCKEQVVKSVNEYIKEVKGEEARSEQIDLPTKQ